MYGVDIVVVVHINSVDQHYATIYLKNYDSRAMEM